MSSVVTTIEAELPRLIFWDKTNKAKNKTKSERGRRRTVNTTSTSFNDQPKVQNECIHLRELEIRDAIRDRCAQSPNSSVLWLTRQRMFRIGHRFLFTSDVKMEKGHGDVNEDFLGFVEVNWSGDN
jgi:hypothetical protein